MNELRKYALTSFICFILTLSVFSYVILRCEGQDTNISVVNPETGTINFDFYTNTTSAGTRFNVTIFVYDVNDLYAFQVSLMYNSTILNATRAWVPVDISDYVFFNKPNVPLRPNFYFDDPKYGTSVFIGGTLRGPVPGFSGDGLLGIVEFEIMAEPEAGESLSCELNVDNPKSRLLNSALENISTSKTNGVFKYSWVPPVTYLAVVPSYYETGVLKLFNITIEMRHAFEREQLVNLSFTLTFDESLLNVSEVIEGSFFKTYGNTTFFYKTHNGNLTVKLALTNYTAFPYGDGDIAIITFEGIHQDYEDHSCNLEIKNVKLFNSTNSAVLYDPSFTRQGKYTILALKSQLTIYVPDEANELSIAKINGTLTPPEKNVTVTILYRLKGELDWSFLENVTTDEFGNFNVTWMTPEVFVDQMYEFKAEWGGIESNTDLILIKNKAGSKITVNVSPGTTVLIGENITISGKIEPSRVNVTVTILYRLKGELDWSFLESVTTDGESQYSYTFNSSRLGLGKYEISVEWFGDEETEGNSDTIVLEIVEELPSDFMQYVWYAVIAVVIIVIISVVLYFKKFRKS